MIKGIINISGLAGSGKDTFADMLKLEFQKQDFKVLRINYADYLKFICQKYFDWDGNKDEAGRSLLQKVGTDIVRRNNPDFWVELVAYTALQFGDYFDFVICGDCRFPNENNYWIEEVEAITYTINIVRPDLETKLTPEQTQHASETSMQDYPFNYTVMNTGTLEELQNSAETVVQNILSEYIYIKKDAKDIRGE